MERKGKNPPFAKTLINKNVYHRMVKCYNFAAL